MDFRRGIELSDCKTARFPKFLGNRCLIGNSITVSGDQLSSDGLCSNGRSLEREKDYRSPETGMGQVRRKDYKNH